MKIFFNFLSKLIPSLFRRSPIMSAIFAKIITYPWMWLFMRSPNQGAQTIAYLALEPSVKVSGEYFKWEKWLIFLIAQNHNTIRSCTTFFLLFRASDHETFNRIIRVAGPLPRPLTLCRTLQGCCFLISRPSAAAAARTNYLPLSISVYLTIYYFLVPLLQRLRAQGRHSTTGGSRCDRRTDRATGQGVPGGDSSDRN